jgi:DMSO reductase anchor subunit
MNAQQRTALYAVAVAAGGVALIYGLLTSEEVDAWLRVVEAALALITVIAPLVAIKHVTPDNQENVELSPSGPLYDEDNPHDTYREEP